MIDIAVPRDLDPQIASLSNVFLYDIDDLEMIVESNLQERRNEAAKIEGIIDREIAEFERWNRTLGVSPVIQALQTKANAIHEETMDDLFRKLPELSERERKVISKLSKSIVNQMLRDPILRVKEMSGGRDRDKAVEMVTKLFALEPLLEEPVQEHAPERRKEAQRSPNRTVQLDDDWQDGIVPGMGLTP
jgi:glutamyl-tRNA reductase